MASELSLIPRVTIFKHGIISRKSTFPRCTILAAFTTVVFRDDYGVFQMFSPISDALFQIQCQKRMHSYGGSTIEQPYPFDSIIKSHMLIILPYKANVCIARVKIAIPKVIGNKRHND